MPSIYVNEREGPPRRGVRGTFKDRFEKLDRQGRRCSGQSDLPPEALEEIGPDYDGPTCLKAAKVKQQLVKIDKEGQDEGEPFERVMCRQHARYSPLGTRVIDEQEF